MATFTLPLPPTTNAGYKTGSRYEHGRWVSRIMKTDRLIAWEDEARFIVRQWEPPRGVPLIVRVTLQVRRGFLRRMDIDGTLKFLVDLVVGKRRDQWIDRLEVSKVEGDDTAIVTVEAIGREEGCE